MKKINIFAGKVKQEICFDVADEVMMMHIGNLN